MLSRDPFTGQFTFASPNKDSRISTASTHTRSSSSQRPYALDDDASEFTTADSRSSTASRGYRDGGPKEARMKRVAFLSQVKEVDHLFPVKIEKIGRNASEESISATFAEFGEVGDIYIPKDSKNRPLANFAIVRYTSPEGRDRALSPQSFSDSSSSKKDRLSVSPLRPQNSFFSKGTGYHGICNIPVEDGTYNRRPVTVHQDITLESCRSRSGYPWGSVRELKFLAPHPPPDSLFSYVIRVDDLPRHITEEQVREAFLKYGEVVEVTCPKPLIVTQQTKDSNCGYAFVRFRDSRDRQAAIRDIGKGNVIFDGQAIVGKALLPSFWPTEQTRRYY